MTRFNVPSALKHADEAIPSPNGRFLIVLTTNGKPETDEVESVVSLFEAADMAAYLNHSAEGQTPKRRVLVDIKAVPTHVQTESYAPIITELRWSRDSRYLYFLGEDNRKERRLYRIDVHGRQVEALSPAGLDVMRFDTQGNIATFRASRLKDDDVSRRKEASTGNDATDVTGYSIEQILFPNERPSPEQSDLWLTRIEGSRVMPSKVPYSYQVDISYLPEAFSLAPDGRTVVELRSVSDVPPIWSEYQMAAHSPYRPISSSDDTWVSPTNLLRLKQYVAVDLATGVVQPLLNAPQSFSLGYSRDSQVAWPRAGQQILVTNTFLPLGVGSSHDQNDRREGPCAVAVLNRVSGQATCVVTNHSLSENSWGAVIPETLSLGPDSAGVSFDTTAANGKRSRHVFRLDGDDWKPQYEIAGASLQGASVRNQMPISLIVKQGLNDPPTLWATDHLTGKSKQVWDPNPQFEQMSFGKASVFHWSDSGGHPWVGGLVNPAAYSPQGRYPLVIQIYSFEPSQFLTDGVMPTAFAARALASSGIAVLQVQRRLPHTFTVAEADAQLDGIVSAIDQLSKQGLVDPDRVGIVGFSFSAWYVENALIKAPGRFRVATIADGIDVSYMQYHLWGPTSAPLEREFEAIIGSTPTGSGLSRWTDYSPGFHLDKIATPLRVEAIGPGSVLGEWEIYSTLHRLGKPIDLIYFPEGQHIHQRPRERISSQQGNVDWMRFYLQGYEDPDPSKQVEYRQWRRMALSPKPTGGAGNE